jgi:hypothetical protein
MGIEFIEIGNRSIIVYRVLQKGRRSIKSVIEE